MSTQWPGLLLVAILLIHSGGQLLATPAEATVSGASVAKATTSGAAKQGKDEKQQPLPAPLDRITGNFLDLESTGYFKIAKTEFGRTDLHRDDALIWTLEVTRPISVRHALRILQQLGDVRFYRTEEDWFQQLHMTHLHYTDTLDARAVRNEILGNFEEFRVWVILSGQDIYGLTHGNADTVVFQELRKRYSSKPKNSVHDISTDYPTTKFGHSSKARGPGSVSRARADD